jgi:hypothetical protein
MATSVFGACKDIIGPFNGHKLSMLVLGVDDELVLDTDMILPR